MNLKTVAKVLDVGGLCGSNHIRREFGCIFEPENTAGVGGLKCCVTTRSIAERESIRHVVKRSYVNGLCGIDIGHDVIDRRASCCQSEIASIDYVGIINPCLDVIPTVWDRNRVQCDSNIGCAMDTEALREIELGA